MPAAEDPRRHPTSSETVTVGEMSFYDDYSAPARDVASRHSRVALSPSSAYFATPLARRTGTDHRILKAATSFFVPERLAQRPPATLHCAPIQQCSERSSTLRGSDRSSCEARSGYRAEVIGAFDHYVGFVVVLEVPSAVHDPSAMSGDAVMQHRCCRRLVRRFPKLLRSAQPAGVLLEAGGDRAGIQCVGDDSVISPLCSYLNGQQYGRRLRLTVSGHWIVGSEPVMEVVEHHGREQVSGRTDRHHARRRRRRREPSATARRARSGRGSS